MFQNKGVANIFLVTLSTKTTGYVVFENTFS